MTALDAAVALARLGEAGGAAVLFGAPLLLILARLPPPAWSAPLARAAAALLALASVVALVLQTTAMAGSLREALAPATLADVVAQTAFGRSVALRVAAALAALTLARRRPAIAALGAAALASLAWSGHGAADMGARGTRHLGGDLAHLLAAGAWIGALAALVPLARDAGRGVGDAAALAAGLGAFSGVGVAVVGLLLGSGLANVIFLAGAAFWRAPLGDAWSAILCAKLAVVAAMLALAALNRWRWVPALVRGGGEDGPAVRALRRSLVAEAGLGLLALAAAATMGGLAPPASGA